MCDYKDPCCILSPIASNVACMAKGGNANTDPCNVLNPTASAGGCNAQTAANAAKKSLPEWGLLLIIIAVILLIILFFVFLGSSSTTYGGGKRVLGINKLLKKIF